MQTIKNKSYNTHSASEQPNSLLLSSPLRFIEDAPRSFVENTVWNVW